MNIVYLNNEFLSADQACVPVLDRGFIFGDGVYEVIPVYGGKLFRLNEHLQRLQNSLSAVRIPNPLNHAGWGTMLNENSSHKMKVTSSRFTCKSPVAVRNVSTPCRMIPYLPCLP